jgi:hypothetical protein
LSKIIRMYPAYFGHHPDHSQVWPKQRRNEMRIRIQMRGTAANATGIGILPGVARDWQIGGRTSSALTTLAALVVLLLCPCALYVPAAHAQLVPNLEREAPMLQPPTEMVPIRKMPAAPAQRQHHNR